MLLIFLVFVVLVICSFVLGCYVNYNDFKGIIKAFKSGNIKGLVSSSITLGFTVTLVCLLIFLGIYLPNVSYDEVTTKTVIETRTKTYPKNAFLRKHFGCIGTKYDVKDITE